MRTLPATSWCCPRTWEGFGLPLIESALHRRPIAVGGFVVAAELASVGFDWFDLSDPARLRRWLADPDPALLDHNQALAHQHFGLSALRRRLAALLDAAGWATERGDCQHSPNDSRVRIGTNGAT